MRNMENAFTKVFGKSSMKVLDVALDWNETEFTIPDLCKATGLSRKTVDERMAALTEAGIITLSRRVGTTGLYEIDKKNPFTKHLLAINKELIKRQESSLGK
jgi:DNA-binding transcriptional ArsR family regulator